MLFLRLFRSRPARSAPGRFGIRALLAALMLFVLVRPASAWKPHDHIFAANQAIANILAGANNVQINGVAYAVDPQVANAIRNFPRYYRAGVIGPDAYPDIYVGQAFIHPDTRADNGILTGNAIKTGHGYSFTYEWLRHVFQSGWNFYNMNFGVDPAAAERVLAFTYGYITHAAGDMWAHTFVNDFARGIFPAITDVPNLPIGIRHLVVESYIGTKSPAGINLEIDAPLSHIYNTLMAGGENGGFVDSANQDAASLGRGAVFDFFFGLRNGLDERRDAMEALGPLNPLWLLFLPVKFYIDAWIDDIDDGLQEWPDMSHDIALAVMATTTPDFTAASDRVGEMLPQVISMLGVPDAVIALFQFISDILSIFDPIFDPLKEAAKELRNYLIKQLTGIDIEALKDFVTHPENHVNSPLIGLSPGTSDALDVQMGITPGGPGPYNPDAFAAMKNTIVTSKLILLSANEMNQLLHNHRVGPIYSDGFPNSDRANAILGFIHTIDGHQQWRRTTFTTFPNSPAGSILSEGMPLWSDCLARDRVFRSLFTDWQNTGFPDLGEAPINISATPPPTSSLDVLGPTYAVGNVVYVGGTTAFQVSAAPDYFWNADEITVSGSIAPGGPSLSGASPINLGSINGPDGVYTVTYNATGHCINGPPHGETDKTATFTLDQTPPVITVNSPTEGQSLDVIDTVVVDFSAVDAGAGLDTIQATLDGALIQDGDTIDAFLLEAGEHHLVVTAVDNLGNTAVLDRTFLVQATIPGLIAAYQRARAEMLITLPPNDNQVLNHLNKALEDLAAGRISSVINRLESVRNHVEGQRGKGIDPFFADRYIGWINDLISRL